MDDEEMLRDLAEQMLGHLGYETDQGELHESGIWYFDRPSATLCGEPLRSIQQWRWI